MREKEMWIETAQTETYGCFWGSRVFLHREIYKLGVLIAGWDVYAAYLNNSFQFTISGVILYFLYKLTKSWLYSFIHMPKAGGCEYPTWLNWICLPWHGGLGIPKVSVIQTLPCYLCVKRTVHWESIAESRDLKKCLSAF